MTKTSFWLGSCLTLFLLIAGSARAEEDASGIRATMARHGQTEATGMLAPTICELAGVPRPKQSEVDPLPEILNLAREKFANQPVQKILVFCPDAIGKVQFETCPNDFAPLLAETDYLMTGTNVLPSVTPVCFSTIFSGCSPAVHGIRKYEKPVLTVETVFDTFAAAGKKVAIVAEKDSSIERVFRNRPIAYYPEPPSETSFQTTKRLVEEKDVDFIVCYDAGYDDAMHANGVWAEPSLDAMRTSIRRWLELVRETDEAWSGFNRVIVFAPDHGSHDLASGKGTHGTDEDSDVLVNHAWRLRAAQ